jgi:hypothetical protein
MLCQWQFMLLIEKKSLYGWIILNWLQKSPWIFAELAIFILKRPSNYLSAEALNICTFFFHYDNWCCQSYATEHALSMSCWSFKLYWYSCCKVWSKTSANWLVVACLQRFQGTVITYLWGHCQWVHKLGLNYIWFFLSWDVILVHSYFVFPVLSSTVWLKQMNDLNGLPCACFYC